MKHALVHVIGLLCALAIFSGSVVYSATSIPTVDTVSSSNEEQYENDFSLGNLSSEPLSSEVVSSESPSSEVVSSESPSSEVVSSESPSSEVVSSASPSSEVVSSESPSSEVVSSESPSSEVESSEPTSSQPPTSSEVVPSEPPIADDDYAQFLDTLAGAVQREIVGTNTEPATQYYESYKAQAVASHTYMEYYKSVNGRYPNMPYSVPKATTITLVEEVLNEFVYYNSQIINAQYHAASGGHTQSASYVWGGSVPYLVGVESSYDDYDKTSVISVDEVQQKLESNGIYVSGDPSTWFDLSGATLTDGGFIDYMLICGQSVKGRTLREVILGFSVLKSPKITDIQVNGNDFIFTTKGYGHGVGLSQIGAKGYSANENWDYKMILSHYYPGCTIE